MTFDRRMLPTPVTAEAAYLAAILAVLDEALDLLRTGKQIQGPAPAPTGEEVPVAQSDQEPAPEPQDEPAAGDEVLLTEPRRRTQPKKTGGRRAQR